MHDITLATKMDPIDSVMLDSVAIVPRKPSSRMLAAAAAAGIPATTARWAYAVMVAAAEKEDAERYAKACPRAYPQAS